MQTLFVIVLYSQGLQYINSVGLVHLDIKPENIFICNPEAQLEATVPSDVTCTAKECDIIDGLLPVYKIGMKCTTI